jgi:NADPH:quinone reductase-like Zn-dependent oxidoreductase
MTAWQALFDNGHLQRGQRVLIHGAAGGVGSYAVQLAKWAGAYVAGTAAGKHHSMLRELGADELVDYQTQKFEDVFHDMDLVIHTIGQDQVLNSLKVLKPGGRLVALSADPMSEEAEKQGKVSVGMSMVPVAEQLKKLAGLIQDLQVRPLIDAIVPLEEAPQAMTELQGGHVSGKLGVRLR